MVSVMGSPICIASRMESTSSVFRTATRTEADVADYPLEWAELRLSFFEPETIAAATLSGASESLDTSS